MIMTTPWRRTLISAALALLAGGAGPASADTLTLTGSSIPLRDCRVEAVRGGRVFYLDSRGRRHRRGLDEVEALGFDGLGELDEAERALAAGDLAEGVRRLLAALVAAESDLQRSWIHVRLSMTHDLLGQHVQAAGHAAAVFAADDDPYWRRLEPLSEPDEPSYAAAREALLALQEARRRVKHPEMAPLVERMLMRVRPIHDRLAARYSGPPIEPGSTISGVLRTHIRAGLTPESPPAPATRPAGPGDPPKPTDQPADLESRETPDSPRAIDLLLEAQRWAQAVAACERVAQRVGKRDLGRFLHQYGRALAGDRRPRDAAVMFVRSATLFGDSAYAAASLLETAIIYRDGFRNSASARRLADRGLDLAMRQGRTQVAERARAVLESLAASTVGDSRK